MAVALRTPPLKGGVCLALRGAIFSQVIDNSVHKSTRMAKDPTFTDKDVIRIYERNLDPVEQGLVRQYFETKVFGGFAYWDRLVGRLVLRTLEEFGRAIDAPTELDVEQQLLIQDIARRERERRPRFRTAGGF